MCPPIQESGSVSISSARERHGVKNTWNAVLELIGNGGSSPIAGPFFAMARRPSLSSIAATTKCMTAMSFVTECSLRRRCSSFGMRVANSSRVRRSSASRRLLLRAGWTTGTTPTRATAVNGLRLRDYGRHRSLLPRRFLGNRLWRTTRTTWAPLPAPLATTAPTVLRPRLAGGNASEQRLDRGADFLLDHVADHRHQAHLPRHRSSVRLRDWLLVFGDDLEGVASEQSCLPSTSLTTVAAQRLGSDSRKLKRVQRKREVAANDGGIGMVRTSAT